MREWKNLVIKIDEEEHRRIKTLAAQQGISIKQLVLDGVEKAVNENLGAEKEVRNEESV
jgi:predicted HicB family RNase H-like nuclease